MQQQKQHPRSGIGGVDAVYVINLGQRGDRRCRMRALLHSVGLHPLFIHATDSVAVASHAPELFPALLASAAERHSIQDPYVVRSDSIADDWAVDTDSQTAIDVRTIFAGSANDTESSRMAILGSLGCWQSHTRVLGTACRRRETVLVLEDDVDVTTDIATRIEQLLAEMPETWGIVKLGNCGFDATPADAVVPELGLFRATGFTCLHAVLVHPLAACAIHNAINQPTPRWPVDVWVTHVAINSKPGIESYVLEPGIAVQVGAAGSDIPSSAGKPVMTLPKSAEKRLSGILNFQPLAA